MGTPHAIPLPTQAMQLLDDIRNISGDEVFIFPGDHYQIKPMSENTINKALRHMGYDTKRYLWSRIQGHGLFGADRVRQVDKRSR